MDGEGGAREAGEMENVSLGVVSLLLLKCIVPFLSVMFDNTEVKGALYCLLFKLFCPLFVDCCPPVAWTAHYPIPRPTLCPACLVARSKSCNHLSVYTGFSWEPCFLPEGSPRTAHCTEDVLLLHSTNA